MNGHYYGWHHFHMIRSICMFCVQYYSIVYSERARLPISIEPYTIHHSIHNKISVPNNFFFYFGSLGPFWQWPTFHLFLLFAMEAFLMSSLSYPYLAINWCGVHIFRLNNDSILSSLDSFKFRKLTANR